MVKRITICAGIETGKRKLDVALDGSSEPMQVENTPEGYKVLMEWLQKYIFPAEDKNVDEQFVRWGTKLGCLEMIRGGTTTYVDMYYYEDAIADEDIDDAQMADILVGSSRDGDFKHTGLAPGPASNGTADSA